MKRLRCLVLPALLVPALWGCNGVTLDVGSRLPGPAPLPEPGGRPDRTRPTRPGSDRFGHLPQRQSFCAKSDVQLKEGCYAGDFVLGSAQIEVTGAGVDKTVIHGNLVLQTQCTVSNLTVTGDVIFEGNQAELIDADFFGRVIDKGVQNRY